MPTSLSQPADLTCPDCGHTFPADIWLLIDASERPDLLDRVRAGTLHDIPCPHCGHASQVDAPLLLYRPQDEPRLIFSPAQGTTAEQDRELAGALLGLLRERLGPAWRDEWVAAMATAPRQGIVALLADNSEIARSPAKIAPTPFVREEDPAVVEGDTPTAIARSIVQLMLEGKSIILLPDQLTDDVVTALSSIALMEQGDRAAMVTQLAEVFEQSLATPVERFPSSAVSGGMETEDEDIPISPQFRDDFQSAEQGEQRYLQAGDPAALDIACAAWSRILDHPDFATSDIRFQLTVLNDSGSVFLRRYWIRGFIEDLNRALTSWQNAISSLPSGSSDLPLILSNLASGLNERYVRMGNLEDLTQALIYWEQAVKLTDGVSSDLPTYLNNLALGLKTRYSRTKELKDLVQAVNYWERAVKLADEDSPDLPMFLNNLADGLSSRHERTGEIEDLVQAVAYWEQAVKTVGEGSPDLPMFLNNLATGLSNRYKRTNNLEDLTQAIAYWKQAVKLINKGASGQIFRLNNLAKGLSALYARTDDLEDLTQAIAHWKRVVELTSEKSPNLSSRLNNLALSLSDRYTRTGNLEDLTQAVVYWEQAVKLMDEGSPHLLSVLNNLANGLSDRYARVGNREDLAQAVVYWERAVKLAGEESPHLFVFFNNLANGLSDRYAQTGDIGDLTQAIAYWEQAVKLIDEESPDLLSILNNLATGLSDRYARMGDLKDLTQAVVYWERAAKLINEGSPYLSIILNNLATGLHNRYIRVGDMKDLMQAIAHWKRATKLTDEDSPYLALRLNNLALGLSEQYERTGSSKDLTQAVNYWERAVKLIDEGSPDLPSVLNNLATGLRNRYAHTGNLQDLAQAVTSWERAARLTNEDSPDLPSILNNLAAGLKSRYTLTGNLEDLTQAVNYWERAAKLTDESSPDMPAILNNLANGLIIRYERIDDLEDLVQAVVYWERTVKLMDKGSPHLPSILNNLANGLKSRYEWSGDLGNLAQAIAYWERTVKLTNESSPDRPGFLNNLASGLISRYDRTGGLEDLAQAIAYWKQVVKLEDKKSPTLPSTLSNLAGGLRTRYEQMGDPGDLTQAQTNYREACELGLAAAPESTIVSGRSWGNWALDREAWQESIQAYDYAFDAVGQLLDVQVQRSSKEAWLKEVQGLPGAAAYARAKLGDRAGAVAILENKRTRLLAEALEATRADLERLPGLGHKGEYDAYVAAVDRLATLRQQIQNPPPEATPTERAELRRELKAARAERKATIEAIRAIEGYEDFFKDLPFERIAVAAGDAPLVYLLTTPAGGLALIVDGGGVEEVWLEFRELHLNSILFTANEFDRRFLQGSAGADWDALQKTLEWALPLLGQRIMQPLAQALTRRTPAPRRVTLVPTGRLALLPLHVARLGKGEDALYFCDEFMVRYAPSAQILSRARTLRQRQADGPVQLAGVGNPLPGLETGRWALARIAELLPLMEAVDAQTNLLPIPDDLPAPLVDGFKGGRERLLTAWQDGVKQLSALRESSPETVIRAGATFRTLRRLLALFAADVDMSQITAMVDELANRIPPSLDSAEDELRSVLDLLPASDVQAFFGHEATRDALWAALPQANWLHLACHGQFDPETPLDSALLLAQETRLTLRDLMGSGGHSPLEQVRLAFLSACQTAITDFSAVPDESVGLPSGFLQAGVPGVVGTLWPVNDRSTALLATRFYELVLHGDPGQGLPPQSPLHALHQAQGWLRTVSNEKLAAYLEQHRQFKDGTSGDADRMSWTLYEGERRRLRQEVREGRGADRPYRHPYHWASFTFYGVG